MATTLIYEDRGNVLESSKDDNPVADQMPILTTGQVVVKV
jgi:hypothetical protein